MNEYTWKQLNEMLDSDLFDEMAEQTMKKQAQNKKQRLEKYYPEVNIFDSTDLDEFDF